MCAALAYAKFVTSPTQLDFKRASTQQRRRRGYQAEHSRPFAPSTLQPQRNKDNRVPQR
jgi:hypothetical protein